MIYVVLGCHKSGTTLLAELLHKAGIPMVDEDQPEGYDAGGLYERSSTKALNKALLGVSHDKWLITRPPQCLDPDGAAAESIRNLTSAMPATWGFKDPRTLLTFDVWRTNLPEHRVIGIFREPRAIWRRTRRPLGLKTWENPARCVRMWRRWFEHNDRLSKIALDYGDRCLILDYESLMTDFQEIERLSSFVGKDLPDLRNSGMWRGRRTRSPGLELSRVFAELQSGYAEKRIQQSLLALSRPD